MKTKILFEDAHIMVIHKPAGIAVQSGRIGQMDCENELKNYLARKGEKPYIGLVHRLDQPVEGILVVAKTSPVAALLNKQLQQQILNKTYMAVVNTEEENPELSGEYVDYLAKEGQLARVVSDDVNGAKAAKLRYQIKKVICDTALLKIQIETGRFHQIRCQMSYHGMPLLGDSKYGTNQSKQISLNQGIKQVALCANEISFVHPITKQKMQFTVIPENKAFSKFL